MTNIKLLEETPPDMIKPKKCIHCGKEIIRCMNPESHDKGRLVCMGYIHKNNLLHFCRAEWIPLVAEPSE